MARREFSVARVMTVKPVGSGKVGRVAPQQNFWQKNVEMDVKMSFFDIMSVVQKDLQDISAGICQLKKSDIKEFCPKFDVKVSKVNFDLNRLNSG